jgi:hypothetical protein
MSQYKNADEAIKIILESNKVEFYFKCRIGTKTMEIETPNFRKKRGDVNG